MGRFSEWFYDKIILIVIFSLILIMLLIPSFLPYIGQFIAGGMPDSSGTPVRLTGTLTFSSLRGCVLGNSVKLCVTDAFVCNHFWHTPYSIFSSGENRVAKPKHEFVFIGLIASKINGVDVTLPKPKDVRLFCGPYGTAAGTLPTNGEPFSVFELRERSKLFFFPFSADPYGFSLGGFQPQTDEKSGYIVYLKPNNVRLDECLVSILVKPENSRVLWSLSTEIKGGSG